MPYEWNVLKIFKRDIKNAQKQLENLDEGFRDYMKDAIDAGKTIFREYSDTLSADTIGTKQVDEFTSIMSDIADFLENLFEGHLTFDEE